MGITRRRQDCDDVTLLWSVTDKPYDRYANHQRALVEQQDCQLTRWTQCTSRGPLRFSLMNTHSVLGPGEVPKSGRSGDRQNPDLSYEKQNDCEDCQILRPRTVYVLRMPYKQPRCTVYVLSPPCCIYRVRYGIHFLIVHEAHVRSVSNEPTSGCEARVQKSRHRGILCDEVVQRCCEKGVVVPGWCRQEGAGRS